MLRIFVFALLAGGSLGAQTLRIDPPHWWVGTASNELELLVSSTVPLESVSLQAQGVTLLSDVPAANPKYRYVTVALAPNAQPEVARVTAVVKGKKIRTDWEVKARRPRAAAPGLTQRDVIYLVTPDRFANGNPSNDDVPGMTERGVDRSHNYKRHGGDLAGMIAHLDYVKSLGATAVWPMPLLENDMPAASYHGYAITDHYRIDPRYGTHEEYLAWTDGLHARGMKAIKDMVYNHVGTGHYLFQSPPDSTWFNAWPIDPSQTASEKALGRYKAPFNSIHRYQTLYDPYASDRDRERHTDGWFDGSMPDVNGRDPHCARYFIQNSLWWIEEAQLDGFRVDTWLYPDQAFLREWMAAVKAFEPQFYVYSESWVHSAHAQAFYLETHPDLTGAADFPMYWGLKNAVERPSGWNEGMADVYNALAADYLYGFDRAGDHLVTFLDNHDEGRFYGKVGKDLDRFKLGLGMLYTLRGIPSIYYGTELLYSALNDHGAMRQDFAGGWPGDKVSGFTGQGLTADQREAQAYVRQLGALRASQPLIGTGNFMQFTPDMGSFAYAWYSDSEVILVLANGDDRAHRWPTERVAELGITPETPFTDLLQGGTSPAGTELTFPAKGIRILRAAR
ncbi:MAG: alpha-amylase family glycosyl hydrolase [Schleiferiaceae bacterium]